MSDGVPDLETRPELLDVVLICIADVSWSRLKRRLQECFILGRLRVLAGFAPLRASQSLEHIQPAVICRDDRRNDLRYLTCSYLAAVEGLNHPFPDSPKQRNAQDKMGDIREQGLK